MEATPSMRAMTLLFVCCFGFDKALYAQRMKIIPKVSRIMKGPTDWKESKLGKTESMLILLFVCEYYMVFYEI